MIPIVELSAIISICGTIGGATIGIWQISKWVSKVENGLSTVNSTVNTLANNHIPHLEKSVEDMRLDIQALKDVNNNSRRTRR